MSPPQVPNTDQAGPELVTITLRLTQNQLIELRRGVVQRMSVARSNKIADHSLGPDVTRYQHYWQYMYDECWTLYQMLLAVSLTPSHNMCSASEGDEFDYLSQEV